MAKYRKKPVVVEAMQWLGWGKYLKQSVDLGVVPCDYCSCEQKQGVHGVINTLEGPVIVRVGDWIVIGTKDKFYPYKPDIFEATYEAVNPAKAGGENET